MIENWEFCNSIGGTKMIGFKARLVNCREAAYLNLQLKVNNATPRKIVTLRIYPLSKDISEVRFWCDDNLIDIQRVKNSDLKVVHF